MMKRIICVLSIIFIMFGMTGCGLENELLDYKAEAKIEIEAYAESKGKDNYSAENWLAIEKAVEDGKAEIEAAADKEGVDMAVVGTKNDINAILTEEQEMSDFILTISVDNNTKSFGEDFIVEVNLKNQSGEDAEIAVSILFWPYIFDWNYPIDIDSPEHHGVLVANQDVLQESWTLGDDLELGTHELKFRARFILNWQQKNEQLIELWSNTVVLTVQ